MVFSFFSDMHSLLRGGAIIVWHPIFNKKTFSQDICKIFYIFKYFVRKNETGFRLECSHPCYFILIEWFIRVFNFKLLLWFIIYLVIHSSWIFILITRLTSFYWQITSLLSQFTLQLSLSCVKFFPFLHALFFFICLQGLILFVLFLQWFNSLLII